MAAFAKVIGAAGRTRGLRVAAFGTGGAGVVPAVPGAQGSVRFLREDGTWNVPGVDVVRRTVTPPYTVVSDDSILHVNGAGFVFLPTPTSGRTLRIKRTNPTGDVRLEPTAGSLIEGQPYVLLLVQGEELTVIADGANWHLH